jgi:hypothetical protein
MPMIIRLLMHPMADIALTALSLGLMLLSIGLVSSVLWNSPAIDDVPPPAAPISVAVAPAGISPIEAALPCAQHSGFLPKAAVVDCKR